MKIRSVARAATSVGRAAMGVAALACLGMGIAEASPPISKIELTAPDYEYFGIDADPRTGRIYTSVLGSLYNVRGDRASRLQGTDFDIEPRLSPDGKQIAFMGTVDSDDAVSGRMQLYVLDLETHARAKLPLGDLEGRSLNDGGVSLEPTVRKRQKQRARWWQMSVRFPVWARSGKVIFASVLRGDGKDVVREYNFATKSHVDWDIAAFEGFDVCADNECLYVATDVGIERIDRSGNREILHAADGEAFFRPRLSPDGKRLIFIRSKDKRSSFAALDLATKKISNFAPIADALIEPAPEGSRTLYASRGMFPAFGFVKGGKAIVYSDQGKMFVADLAGKEAKPLLGRPLFEVDVPLRPAAVSQRLAGDRQLKSLDYPAWSRDRARIVFSALGHIWEYDGQKSKRVTSSSAREYMPSLSPDGRKLAFVRWDDDKLGQIVERNLESGSERIVSKAASRYYTPRYSADGASIIALKGSSDPKEESSSYFGKNFNIIGIDIASGNEARIADWGTFTDSAAGVLFPNIQSLASGRIYFDKFTADDQGGGRFGLHSVARDGSDPRLHLALPANTSRIVVSPNGKFAAAFGGGKLGVYSLGGEQEAKPVFAADGVSAYYAQWLDDETLAWSFANKFNIWKPADGGGPQQKIIAIDYTPDHAPGLLVLANARLVTMSDKGVIEKGAIVIRDGRIVHIGPDIPAAFSAAPRVDLAGKTIVPGYIDAHAHSHQQALQDLALLPEHKWGYYGSLAAGVTTLFDPAADDQAVFAQAELVDAGAMLGPRVYSTGKLVGGDNFHFATRWLYQDIPNVARARAILQDRLDIGAIFAKSYRLNRPARIRLNAAARELGIGIALEGRIEDYLDNFRMVREANTSIEHDPEIGLRSDWIELLGRSKTHITLTAYINYFDPVAAFAKGRMLRDVSGAKRFERFVAAAEREQEDYRLSQAQQQPVSAELKTQFESILRLQRAGVEFSYGAHQNSGYPIHFDLWQFAAGGFSNQSVLEMVTINGARKLGLDRDLGSLEAGKVADLVVLDGNPLADILATREIAYVMKGGRVYDGPTLRELFPRLGQCHYFHWFDKSSDMLCASAETGWKERVQ